MLDKLAQLKSSRDLVSIKRERFNDLIIQGIVLEYSSDLVLLQYVYDFNLDGLMVLRLSDITSMVSDSTDIVQTNILKDEGLYSEIDFTKHYAVADWYAVFSTIGREYGFCIVEDESPDYPVFMLGELRKVENERVTVLGFSGAASWDDGASEIAFKDISSFQVGNNYLNVYERHLKSQAKTNPPI